MLKCRKNLRLGTSGSHLLSQLLRRQTSGLRLLTSSGKKVGETPISVRWVWCQEPMIQAMWEAIGRISQSEAAPDKNVRPYLKNN
jgi:hypothetical protein